MGQGRGRSGGISPSRTARSVSANVGLMTMPVGKAEAVVHINSFSGIHPELVHFICA